MGPGPGLGNAVQPRDVQQHAVLGGAGEGGGTGEGVQRRAGVWSCGGGAGCAVVVSGGRLAQGEDGGAAFGVLGCAEGGRGGR